MTEVPRWWAVVCVEQVALTVCGAVGRSGPLFLRVGLLVLAREMWALASSKARGQGLLGCHNVLNLNFASLRGYVVSQYCVEILHSCVPRE